MDSEETGRQTSKLHTLSSGYIQIRSIALEIVMSLKSAQCNLGRPRLGAFR